MEKSTAEKAIDGVLLSKLGDRHYFITFTAFGLYWDSYSYKISGYGLLNLSYTVGDAFPVGKIIVLIASFSLFASILSPTIFWICNRTFWEVWFPISSRIFSDASTSEWIKTYYPIAVSTHRLKLWAIKTSNSLAMSLVKDKEKLDAETRGNRPQPFLLALCICFNYFYIQGGILKTAENALSSEIQSYFESGLLAFVFFLLYIAFNGVHDDDGYIYLPGLKEYIKNQS